MASLFPRWSNSLAVVVLVVLASAVLGVPLMLLAWVRTPQVTGQFLPLAQPVEFDHRHHVADDGIDCLYCHEDAERAPYAGVPPTERCLNCHSQIWTGSPLLAPVWRSWETGEPIPWVRVNRLPDFVFFDHSVHVHKGVGCVTCHGRVDRMARVYQAAPLTMHWCINCHVDPAPNLRPREAVTSMTWTSSDPTLGARLARAYRVRSLTSCTTCHR